MNVESSFPLSPICYIPFAGPYDGRTNGGAELITGGASVSNPASDATDNDPVPSDDRTDHGSSGSSSDATTTTAATTTRAALGLDRS